MQDAIDLQNAEIARLLQQQFEVEDKINRKLIPQTEEQDFKTLIAVVFAALVGFVVLGFFYIAHLDEIVRQAIFSGESGIQFITLFSLVIAIILFGITGILEDKELAALLGGISGYILGRGTAEPRTPAGSGTAGSGTAGSGTAGTMAAGGPGP